MVPPPWRQIQLSGGSRRTLHVFGDAAEEPALSGGMPKVTCCFWFVDVASGIKRGGVSVIPWRVLKMFKNRAAIANPFVRYVSRRTTGFVTDFDDDVSHTMLICDGYALPQAILCLNSVSRVFFFFFSVCRFLSRPPLRGRSVVMSMRNFGTVLFTATHSSNRLCSQTVTSSLSLMMNVSVARVFSSQVASAK